MSLRPALLFVIPVALALVVFLTAWATASAFPTPDPSVPSGLAATRVETAAQLNKGEANRFQKAMLLLCPLH